MQCIHGLDMLTLTLMVSIGLLGLIVVFFWSQKRYELALILILLSPWIHFLFETNIPHTPEDVLSASNTIEPSTYIRLSVVMFAGSIGAYKFFQSRASDEEKIPSYFITFGIFLCYAFLSTSYSIDRTFTFIRSSEFIAFFCFLMGLFTWLKDSSYMDKAIHTFYLVIIVGTLMNAGMLILFPERAWWWQAPDRFQGFMSHPNALGGFCMLSYPILLWEYTRQKTTGRIVIMVLFFTILMMHVFSGSRTSLAASVIGFATWHIIFKKKINFILVATIILFGGYFLGQNHLPSFDREESSSITHLTGRTRFWLGSLELAIEKPILGYGYAVEGKIWEDPRFQSNTSQLWMGSARSSIHNGYLSIVIGLGFMGLVMWLAIIIPPVWQILHLPGDYYKALLLVIPVQCLLINFFESAISSSRNLESIAFWMFWVFAIRHHQLMVGEG